MRRAFATVSVAALAAAAPVVGADAATTKKPATVTKPVTVTIKGFAFSPTAVRVKVGQRIVVRNADPTPHTMTEDASDTTTSANGFDTKTIASGKSATLTLKKAGTYAFHCNIHPTMTGRVVVTR